jgi:hypothetical protein
MVRALAGQLDDEQRERLAARVRRCADSTAVAAALVALAGAGPERLTSEALAAVLELHGENRLWLLAGAPPSDSEEIRTAVADGIGEAARLEDPYTAAELLIALARKLPRDAAVAAHLEAVALTDRVDDEDHAEFLRDLAPHLAPEALRDALARVRRVERERDRRELLEALAPRLPDDAVADAAAAALELSPGSDRTPAFAAVAPRLASADAHACMLDIFGRSSDHDALELLAALVPALAAADRALLLDEAERVADACDRGTLLAALAEAADGEHRAAAAAGVLAAAKGCPYEYQRDEMLERVAPLLADELLERALDLVLELGDDADVLSTVGHLLRRAGPAARLAAPADVLARARALPGAADAPGFGRRAPLAVVLTALAPTLAGDAAAEALELARGLADLPGRAEALAALARALGAERFETMLAAVDELPVEARPPSGAPVLSLTGDDESPDEEPQLTGEHERATVLAPLADVAGPDGASRLLTRALRLKAGHLRARVVARLASHLDEAELVPALDAVLSYRSDDGDDRPDALRALAPRLPLDQRRRALRTALELTYPPDRERSVAALVGALSEDLDLAREALAAMSDWRMIPDAVASLAPALSPEERREWTERIAAADAPVARAVEALVALADTSEDGTRDLAAAQALELARRAREPDVLAAAARLPLPGAAPLLEVALELSAEAEWREDDAPRALALARLAPFLSGDERARAVDAALALPRARARARALATLGAVGEARHALADVLRDAADGDQAAVLAVCRDADLLAPPLVPRETLAAVAEDVLEVTGRWSWR